MFGRGPSATLNHVLYKLLLELAADDFIGSRGDGIHLLLWENTQFVVG